MLALKGPLLHRKMHNLQNKILKKYIKKIENSFNYSDTEYNLNEIQSLREQDFVRILK